MQNAEPMKTIPELPLLFVDLRESQRLVRQDSRDVDELALPLDLPVVAHLPHRDSRLVLNHWEFDRIRPGRTAVHTPRSLSSQRLMGPLPVILLSEWIILALLRLEIGLRRHRFPPRAGHPLMATVLCGLARANTLG